MSKLSINVADYKGVTPDSRQVQDGFIFVAIPGEKLDGRDYIDAAVKAGARAVIVPKGSDLSIVPEGIAMVEAENVRLMLSQLAAAFYMGQPEFLAGVTGTNGKTSCVYFLQQLWEMQGIKAAGMGTLGLRSKALRLDGGESMTTPDPVSFHETLASLAKQGITHTALEVSSHGLDQYRTDGAVFKAAGFTNLTRDHLDYHGTMEAYFEAKARLFSEVLAPDGVAVLNADVPEYEALAAICEARKIKIMTYGYKSEDIRIISISRGPTGQNVHASIMGVAYSFPISLVGTFQVMNIMCALGMAAALNTDSLQACIGLLEGLEAVPGRLETITEPGDEYGVYVDYAHTSDALENALDALRPHVKGRLICVFGCGGDRDKGKRPMMGQVAAERADVVIVTDDNPRSEDPAQIRQEVLAAVPNGLDIGDRREAIFKAVAEAASGDVVLIAGKGHESGQTYKDKTMPFDDRDVAREALAQKKAGMHAA